ncbi:peptidase C15 [Leptolyngbya sp. 7M]|uniref:pyroglutamyl-peptidase I family protein n=1 Tax=Leptolyngbya sp. 7M TaxID=2812896 RepID=UPI001CE4C636|nr:peptidase C15 [Leptolyngbya sp. 7M]QYO62902.1 peptidase C15 [Leptolyngbya sp. 7M]
MARDIIIAKLEQTQPDLLVCCGMAEARSQLNVEAQAVVSNVVLATKLDLKQLTFGLNHTVISYDAGRFVCNSLYHAMLDYLKSCAPYQNGLFVHVPLLTAQNWEPIAADFRQLLERLLTLNH